jgi:hypothetical protein
VSGQGIKTYFTDGAVVLAGLTAYVYSVAFSYEYGYCSYFGIPASFITPSVTIALIAATAIVAFVIPFLQISELFSPVLRRASFQNDGGIFFGYLFLWSVIGLALFLIFGISQMGVLIFISVFFGVGLVFFYPLLWKLLKLVFSKSYREALLQEFHDQGATAQVPRRSSDATSQEKASQNDRRSITAFLIDKFGRNIMLAFYLLVGVCYVANLIGYGNASKTTAFLLLKTPENYAVIRNYGDLIIARGLDPVQKAFTSDFLIMKISDNEKLSLTYSKVGLLSMPK